MITIAMALNANTDNNTYKDIVISSLALRPEGYVLAVDFDGTLCHDKYPEIGEERKQVVEFVRHAKALGVKVILWTLREGALLGSALVWCVERGLIFDAVNDNTEDRKALYGNNPRKVGYDELWDDRATWPWG